MVKSFPNRINEQINKITEDIQNLSGKILRPVVAAIDGASGSGKSTIAQVFAGRLQAVIIPLDDFFSANIPDTQWDKYSVIERLEKVFDWNQVRSLAIEPLRKKLPAKWRPFDFLAGIQQDGTYKMKNEETIRDPSEIILLEGAYSSSSFLADLIDLTILIDVQTEERHKRLLLRDDSAFLEQWHKRWDAVEAYYFEHLRPKTSFDWVIEG
jgi:uridine kinase